MNWKNRIQQARKNSGALLCALEDVRTPLLSKIIIVIVAAYALSPIDLIPDFIPIFGLLDDLIILPAGIWLAVKLLPPELWEEFKTAERHTEGFPVIRFVGLLLILVLWTAGIVLASSYVLSSVTEE